MSLAAAPIVSVIIPTRNRPQLVVRAVASALAQSLANLEVIVVIDGEDAETVCALAVFTDSRLKTIAIPISVGGSDARNIGIRKSTGEFIALLDDDDEWSPDKLSKQLDAARSVEPGIPVVTCRLIARRPTGDEIWPARPMRAHESMSEYLLCRGASIRQGEGFIQTSTLFAPRSLMREVPFTPGLPRHQDWDWLIRVSAHPGVEFIWVWEPLVIYYIDAYRKSISAGRSLVPSLSWVNGNPLVTPRARAYFYATQIAVRCSSPSMVWTVIRNTILYPRAFLIAMGLALIRANSSTDSAPGGFSSMHKVSLIVSTLGERADDICALLRSLVPQVEFISNVVIVDQHPDQQHMSRLLEPFRATLPILHTRSQRGLSRARNHGLPLATGSLIAFPDDDCLYPDGLLEWVVNWFESNVEYDILAVGVEDADGVPSGNRWPQNACDIRSVNAFRTTFSSSLFLWTDLARTARFDTQLGVGSGTPYGSGEETDYVLRLLRTGARGRFDRTRHIIHPRRDMLSGTGSVARAQSYGFGMGHLLRRHSLRTLWASFLAYNYARAAWAFGRGDALGSQLCVAQTKGLWQGFRSPSPAHNVPTLVFEKQPPASPAIDEHAHLRPTGTSRS